MFSKLLIANRGEIAVRVIRACKEMGISTVAVYSTADEDALHVSLADQKVCIGGPHSRESYLNAKNIVSAALSTGAQAIHPGYGFLSENAEFADLCKQNNLIFVGPSSEVISQMGDKDRTRIIMKAAGVPVIPDSEEKLLSKGKHVEIQILADEHGNVVALGERECSVQRNNQKLVEESPSPALTPKIRKDMIDASILAAKAVNYTNAGTLEFLLDGDNFYFTEMNTQLQVEHPVTEMVTGIDIVKWQIRVADGVPLDFKQQDIKLQGASIECRINASATGKVGFYHVPGGPKTRFDTALYPGYVVPQYYDLMLGKLIVHANTREEAIRKMKSALSELVIDGVSCNIEEQIEILSSPAFCSGQLITDFKVGD